VSRTIVVLAGTIVLTLSGGPSALTFTGSGPGGDGAGASGPDARTRASAVALAATAGGRVTGTDVHHEECYYEVEIPLGNGEQVDFHLDESLHVLHWYPDVAVDGAAGD
jgi:hypothetical protein